jgi:predicted kinase
MKKKLVVMVGISGSGKSTFSNGLKTSLNATVVETDAIRQEICGNAEDQTQNGRIFGIAKARVDSYLKQGKNVVIDATSLNAKDRRDWVKIGKENNAEVIAYVVKTDIATAKKRNAGRARKVPEWVIDKQAAKFIQPSRNEGFDDVINV